MSKIVGIVNLHDCPHLGPLTMRRPTGVTSFLGRYGLMDFSLSNLCNSGIDRVTILAETDVHSVRNHLQNGQVWIRNTRLGFQRILTNESLLPVSKFNTDIGNFLANKNVFAREKPDYFVVCPVFMLMSYDYRELIEKHIESGADITVLCKHIVNDATRDFLNCDIVDVEKDGHITGFSTNTCRRKEVDISLESYIINADVLFSICEGAKDISLLYSLRKMIAFLTEKNMLRVNSCFFEGHVIPILSFEHYIRHSFKLLQYEEHRKLFKSDWPIYTATHNTPPSWYGEHAIVSNSFIANGSIIKGRVKHSILSREVVVEEGASVEDSIIFTQAEIGADVKVKYVVADKNAKMNQLKKVSGEKEEYLYIGAGERV